MTTVLINNRYSLDEELGSGGMGVIYRGYDRLLGRQVAVKVLSDPNLGESGRARLLSEAQSAARLNHPNIVSIYDAGESSGEAGGLPFIVMELVEGESLHDRPPSDLPGVYEVIRQLCAALDHAHRNEIIHRDLKPENVLVTARGRVKLTDFGLARSLASRMSAEQTITGTVFYLAPELALGQEFDRRADLYSLGVMFYELAAGRLPFNGEDLLSIVSQHIYAPVVPPRTFRPDLPPAVEDVILRLMAKKPEERFASAADVEQALNLALERGATWQGGDAEEADRLALLEELSRGRLVGRRAELNSLRELWSHVREGHGHLALISGEPGVGKTRLASEMMVQAQLNGAVVLRGGCYEYESATPYLPFMEALRDWVRAQPDEALAEQLNSMAVELARLAPEIETRLGPLPANPALPPNEERLRLFDTVARFFQRLASQHGLVLFLDDLHWVDQGSLNLLHYVLRSLRGERLLALGAYREMELSRSHPLAAALVEWNRDRLALRIPLGRLSQQDVTDLLAALLGEETASPELSADIYRETEGNPFFVEEIVKSLIEQGSLCRNQCRWVRRADNEISLPQSVREAIDRRVSRASDDAQEMLRLAAVIGRRFSFSELALICTQNEDEVLDALDEAAAAQLIQPIGTEVYQFTHDKIREVLYDELNSIRRRRLHQRVGEGLENLHAGSLADKAPDLAHHFIESGDLERGLKYARLAAQKAEQLYAHDEALGFLRHALDCAEGLNDRQSMAEIHLEMGKIHALHTSTERAAEEYTRALQLAIGEKQRAAIESRIGATYAAVGDERGLPYLQNALEHLSALTQPAEIIEATAYIGRYHHHQAEWKQALDYLERARQAAEALEDNSFLGEIYSFLAGVYQQQNQWEESDNWARKSVELGERKGELHAVALGCEFLAENAYSRNQWNDALEYAARARDIAEQIGSPTRQAWAESAFAHTYHGQGDLIMALAAAAAAITLADRCGDRRLSVLARNRRAQIHLDLGNQAAAKDDVDFVLARAAELGQRQTKHWSYEALVAYLVNRGEWQQLDEFLDRWEADLGQTNRFARLLVALRLGRMERAKDLLEQERVEFEKSEGVSPGDHAYALRLLAEFETARGNWPEAKRLLRRAEQTLAATGSRMELAHLYQRRGALELEQGEQADGLDDWNRAYSLLLECGAARPAAWLEEQIGQLSRR